MSGVRSSRKLEAACREQLAYMWLTGQQFPDHNTLWRFYARHREAMRALLERTVRTAVAMGLVNLAVQAVDGTKVGSNASLYRTRNAEELGRLLERLEFSITDLEARNEAGRGRASAALPQELAGRRELRERVREALTELGEQPSGRRINLTDRGARLMKTPRGIIPGYNAQAMVSGAETDGEGGGMLITAASVVDAPDDHGQLLPMLEQARAMTGATADLTLADAGYHSGYALEDCERLGAAGRDAGVARAGAAPALRQAALPLRVRSRPLHLPRGAAPALPRRQPGSGRARSAVPGLRGGVPDVPGVRDLHELSARPDGRDGAAGGGAEPAPGSGWRHPKRGRPTSAAPGLVEPVFGIIKEQLGARRLPAPRPLQRGGRVDAAGHGFQSAHALASLAQRPQHKHGPTPWRRLRQAEFPGTAGREPDDRMSEPRHRSLRRLSGR